MSSSPGSLANQFSEAQNPTTQARVQMAMCSAAQDLGAAPPTDAESQMHTSLATQVARMPQQYTVPFTNMCCAKGITSASTDAEIASMVAAVWNTMAGHPPLPITP
jgi:hypothetical protein